MLNINLIKKKDYLNKVINKSKDDFDLISTLRKECNRIDIKDKDIILNFDKASFKVNKQERKVKSITTFDKKLRKFKEFTF